MAVTPIGPRADTFQTEASRPPPHPLPTDPIPEKTPWREHALLLHGGLPSSEERSLGVGPAKAIWNEFHTENCCHQRCPFAIACGIMGTVDQGQVGRSG